MIAPLPPFRGGIPQFAASSWKALVDAGHEVQAISFIRQYPATLLPGKPQYDPVPPPTPGPVLRRIDSVLPWTWLSTAREIVDFAPDILLFHHSTPFFAPAFGAILRSTRRSLPDVKSFSLVHSAIPHERRPFDTRLNRWFLSQNNGYIVLSEEVERDLWRLGMRQSVKRIHHPVYDRFGPAPSRAEAREHLGIADDTPLILFFGYVRPYKGLQVLLEAITEVRHSVHELRLIVAGEFHVSEKACRDQIARLGIARAVDIRNEFLPDDDVATLFAACDVVVQPYLATTQSGVAQIAFHFEKPMILTDVGGLAEIVQDGRAGMLVPPNDPDALADAIQRFFDEDLAGALSEGVRARKAEFSWGRLVEALESLAT
jgi:glycosyltransferase involved in cell wall biosynthesis